ncbi:hypothetical protein K458DRAFT_143652 [Lentithecium fluviatile CBS 122367]|uniref:Uncharacterized protein n=1 Tax=Lentithecium fluviatile CBS 122367 TaxID=1168545 RepID=A0A6G1IIL2_9PLEO|nr:hypothetical protein K458DRAFT_143652 [Lentithecium fluviatile CBS 122367]
MGSSTTLVTFLFDLPAAARTVELLGSWDNFTKPYPLKHDRRRGHGTWSGCYTFDDIICDGDLDNINGKRTGALKMGGTYWYYYNVDGEERHNPSEPSTTVCPLLPGQRLNVLEVPRESRSRSSSESSDNFTRNPRDKFLTPVPPKPLPSPRLGDLCKESYAVPMHHVRGPRSATYPSSGQSLSPGYARHARSVSTSPQMASPALFSDFKGLKEKLAQKRSASSTRTRSRSVRELEIGAPTLISTTAEEVNLVPLSSLQPPPRSAPMRAPVRSPSFSPPVTARLREFSPLGSHPVDPEKDLHLAAPMDEKRQVGRPRSRSELPKVTATEFATKSTVVRANSSETRRTKVFSNEPWIQSPRFPQRSSYTEEQMTEAATPAPVLERPSFSLEPPSLDARPTSSHGGNQSAGLRQSAVDKNKELPPLPRYIVPAPLFACSSASSSPTLSHDPENQTENEDEDADTNRNSESNSHFSVWSTESITYSSPTSDDEAIHSPTFSSLTSSCSELGSPTRLSARFSISDYMHSPDRDSAAIDEEGDGVLDEEVHSSHLSANPPRLDELRISAFGSGLFDLDVRHGGSGSRGSRGSRRQVACFGLGFQGYKLPEDESTSKVTITEPKLRLEPSFKHDRDSSVSQAETLVNEFGFLGESVL